MDGERGFLDSEVSLPGLDCERCTAWGSGRLLSLSREDAARIASVLPQSRSPIPRSEFRSLIDRIVDLMIACPIPSEAPFNGFLPGDGFGPFTWEEMPRKPRELEPFFRLGNLAFIIRGNRLMNRLIESNRKMDGVSITPIEKLEETWGFLIDDCRVRLAHDGLARETCQLCGRLDSVRSPDQKKRLGLLRASMLKSKKLPRELVPARDIFITDYTHSWYIKQSLYELFGDELSQHLSVKLEQWRIEG